MKVTSTEFQQNVGRYLDAALTEAAVQRTFLTFALAVNASKEIGNEPQKSVPLC